MPGTLRLTREGFGIELRRGPFEVAVDGTSVATIERGGTIEAALEPGRHTLQIQSGRYLSQPRSFEIADGQVVNFRCHGAMMWPRYLASVVKPDLAISLGQDQE